LNMSGQPGGLDNPDLYNYGCVLITGLGK